MNYVKKSNIAAYMLCSLLMVSGTGFFQAAHADDSWASLLKPLVNSVIVPAINSKIDKIVTRVAQKTTAPTGAVPTSVTSPVTDSFFSSPTPAVTTPNTTATPSADAASADWKLPEEPAR